MTKREAEKRAKLRGGEVRKKKVKRVVLGVGYPWFTITNLSENWPTVVKLTPRRAPVESHEIVSLKGVGKYGNWNRVRLVMEVLE